MDLISFFVGSVAGIIVALVAVEFGLKKMFSAPDAASLTAVWSFRDFRLPLVASLDASAAPVPRAAKLVTNGPVPVPSSGIEARVNPAVKGDFVVDGEGTRALLFLGGLRPGALALLSVDAKLVARLRREFDRLWAAGREPVARVGLADLAARTHMLVETRGTVADAVPSGDGWLLRLQDGSVAVGVRTREPLEARGQLVEVRGRVTRSPGGAPLIEAEAITRV